MLEVPKLSDEAKPELPGGNERLSRYKGTLALWVITVLSVLSSITLGLIYKDKNRQIEKLEAENEKYKQILIPALNKTENKLDRIEPVVDTVLSSAKSSAKHFNKILNKVHDVKQK